LLAFHVLELLEELIELVLEVAKPALVVRSGVRAWALKSGFARAPPGKRTLAWSGVRAWALNSRFAGREAGPSHVSLARAGWGCGSGWRRLGSRGCWRTWCFRRSRWLGFGTRSAGGTPLCPAGFAAVQLFEAPGRPAKLLFQLPDLSPGGFNFLAVLACFGFAGWPSFSLGPDALGSLTGLLRLLCLLTLTLAGDLDPVPHHLAYVVAGVLPGFAQFLARALPGFAQLIVDWPALLERPAYFLLRLFQRLAQVVGGGIVLLERFMHLAYCPLEGLAEFFADRPELLAEFLDQISGLIFEPFGRVTTFVVFLVVLIVVCGQAGEKWLMGARLALGVDVRVRRRVLNSGQLLGPGWVRFRLVVPRPARGEG